MKNRMLNDEELHENAAEILRQILLEYPGLMEHGENFEVNGADLVQDLSRMLNDNYIIRNAYHKNEWGK